MAEVERPAAGVDDVVRIAARAFEFDRYLAALLAPRALRADLIALAAFAGEVARIPGYVTDPMIGEIRLQWWHDTVEALGVIPAATGNPIADALGSAMRKHQLSATLLHDIIDAHAARLGDAPFAETSALLRNLAEIDGALATLTHRIVGGRDGPAPSPVLADAALAYGLVRVLVEAPVVLAQGRSLLPVVAGADNASFLIRDMAATVARHADQVRVGWPAMSTSERFAALPVALVRPYLKACERSWDAPGAAIDIAPLMRIWRLWSARHLGRIERVELRTAV